MYGLKVMYLNGMLCLDPGDVEMDIEYLQKAVPQLSKVFRITDKIGEGRILP